MHESDLWLEDRLRVALREEAASIPFTLTVADLERRMAERRRRLPRWSTRVWIAAAALLLVVAAGAAGVAALLLDAPPEPAPQPTLPSMTDLAAAVPEAATRLQGEHDATDPVATPAPDGRYPVGNIAPAFPFVVAAACVGGDRATIEIGDFDATGTYLSEPVPCDGEIHTSSAMTAVTGERLDVTVTADAGVSWILAVREYTEALAEPPAMPPVTVTPGWSLLVRTPDDAELGAPGEGTGIRITVPPDTTRVAIWATCVGDVPATAVLSYLTTELDCRSGETERLELPADPSGVMEARITSEGQIWARVVVEVDTGLEIIYPSAPSLPPDVAAATWATGGTQYLTVGTIGGNTPRLVALPNHRAAVARGDVVVVPVTDGDGRGRIELVSVSRASVVRTVLDSDRFVQDAWYAATHEVVVYVVGTGTAIQFRSVRLDGSEDGLLVEIPVDDPADQLLSLAPGLAHDDSVFVVEACRTAGCERSIFDLATGDARVVDTTASPVCGMIGVVDGLVVGRYRAGCERDDDAAVSVVVSPLDGGPSRTIEAVGDADGIVVPTPDGPRAILLLEMGDDLSQTIVAVDLLSGETSTIHEVPDGSSSFVAPVPVRLPDGYVLLAGSLSDDPAGRGFIVRGAPVLVDLVTGEKTELVNLPHTLEPTP